MINLIIKRNKYRKPIQKIWNNNNNLNNKDNNSPSFIKIIIIIIVIYTTLKFNNTIKITIIITMLLIDLRTLLPLTIINLKITLSNAQINYLKGE